MGTIHHHKKGKPQFVTRIMFKKSGRTYNYISHNLDLRVGDKCVVEGDKGQAFGTVAMAKKKIFLKKRKKPLKRIIRKATSNDLLRLEKNEKLEKEVFNFCQLKIREREIPMKLIKVEFDFKAERATLFFSSDKRVDFRELVKDLGAKFKIKIEMWQIGVRDEARISGGCGICGKVLCCTSYLRDFEPVSIRMAKDQSLSLNPMKISGMCGRLMCCLGYEHKGYCEFKKRSPRLGKYITTPEGKGKITKVSIITESVIVELEDGKRVSYKISDLDIKPEKKEHTCQKHKVSSGMKSDKKKTLNNSRGKSKFSKREHIKKNKANNKVKNSD